ncbi:MAG: hypothetical protein IPL61_10425 [Myxococcales bacterium]|nr:hypothetical protein [Myxococcales bacterium]
MHGRTWLHSRGRPLAVLTTLVLGAVGATAQPVKKPPPGPPAAPTPAPAPTPPTPPTPEPSSESTTPETAPASEANDVDTLRQEYLKLRDELFASRARAATIASALYSTRIQIKMKFGSARFWGVSRAVIRLDGAGVFDDTAGAIATDDAVRFDGWIAPGRHLISVRLELIGKDDERFTTATESTFVVQAVAGKDLEVAVRSADDGDIAYGWKRGERGGYRLHLDVDVKTTARAAAAKAGKTSAAPPPARRTGEAPRAR